MFLKLLIVLSITFIYGKNTNKLTVKCSRQMFCEDTVCALPLSPSRELNMNIAFVGDSIQAQMECDLRQWYTDAKWVGKVESSYIQMGCPWKCHIIKYMRNKIHKIAKNADVIVFNIGAHYEGNGASGPYGNKELNIFLEEITPIFQTFVKKGGILVIRSISATHFNISNGMYSKESYEGTIRCVPHTSTTPAPYVIQQTKTLRNFARSLDAIYLDIYELSRVAYSEHATEHDGKKVIDCRHYCSSCSVYRTWNIKLIDAIIRKKIQLS